MRLIAHLLEFPLLSYYTYSPYWCTCQGQETQSKHISKTYTLMLKLIIHLSLMHTDVCLQHNSLLPQTVGGRECSILTTTQCTASTDCWRKGAYHTDIDTMHHSHRQSKTQWRFFTFWHCCGKGMCLHICHAVMGDTASLTGQQYSIGSWLLSLILYSRLVWLSWVLSAPIVTGISTLSSSFWLDEKTVCVVDSYIT